ncbi:hypothetical protein ABW365_12835 [Enterococcus avium]
MAFDEVIYTISSIIRQSKDGELKREFDGVKLGSKKEWDSYVVRRYDRNIFFFTTHSRPRQLSEQANDYSDRIHLNELKEELLSDGIEVS